MESKQKESSKGNWWVNFLVFFLVFCVIGTIQKCIEDFNKNGFSKISLFSNKAYKTSWNKNILIIEMPYPTKGLVGINEISWGKVDVDELVEDIYNEVKDADYQQCLVCAQFITNYKDKYGEEVQEKTTPHLLVLLNPKEVRKYKNGKYLNEYYHITNRILSEAFGSY